MCAKQYQRKICQYCGKEYWHWNGNPNTAQDLITLFAKCAEGNLSLTYPKEKCRAAAQRNVQAKEKEYVRKEIWN